MNSCTARMEKKQTDLVRTEKNIKMNQESTREKISEIDRRLSVVQTKSSTSQDVEQELLTLRQQIGCLLNETLVLQGNQAELEDRLRQGNLLFYGFEDVSDGRDANECCLRILNLGISSDNIEYVHRIGTFLSNKCRPVIVKFSSYKIKQQILFSSAKLKTCDISEDFFLASRQARKKLVEFGRAKK